MKQDPENFNWKPLTLSWSTFKLILLIAVWPAVAVFIIVVGTPGWLAVTFAWLLLGLCALTFALVAWPWLTTSNPVLSITDEGLHDRRMTPRPIAWEDISFVSYAHDRINLALDLSLDATSRIRWRFPHNLIGRKTFFHVVLATLKLGGRSPLDACLKRRQARMDMHRAKGASFINRLSAEGLNAGNVLDFKKSMQHVWFTHPTWEKSPDHVVKVIETPEGLRLIHAFLNDQLFEQQYSNWEGSLSTIARLVDLARSHNVQEIVIDNGSADELRIDASFFDDLATRPD